MTLRTRTPYPSGATSGPGRSPLSDSRLRLGARRGRRCHGLRGTPARPRPHLRRHPDPGPDPGPDLVRRRAEALLGGASPPQAAALPPGPPQAAASPSPLRSPSDGEDPPAPPPDGAAEVLPAAAARRLAVRERLPVWLQARCAVEPRTVAAVGVVLVAAVGFAGHQFWSARPQGVTAPAPVAPAVVPAGRAASAGTPAPEGGGAGPARIVIDVGGKVRDPGVRRLPAGSRVEDALAAAGGVRPGTDTTGLNRARVLVDGEQVLVGVTAQPPPGGASGGPAAGPLSLGSATVEQLDGLPGVGPVLAQHIVDFRTARGGFRSVEELRQVNGIGERRFADLRKLVRP
ncbi:ComEA family DNA-binding protein [Streptomyces sp. fd1-xmd]|uniref:ComEA family DNA-binding protein n=1 Tax=Streptomyces sp. fd1-xmd TaxID=1812480 RepID=UPI000990710B|nr:ComEA family DNA-binding protein [Streptomyces sp. fd1-xmd]AQT72447.1 DNA-binding protein [Streptomyces sp. fd1-xmd]